MSSQSFGKNKEKNKTITNTEAKREAEKRTNSKGKEDRRETNGKKCKRT